MSLWSDRVEPARVRRVDTEASRSARAIALAREGLDGKACAALHSQGLTEESAGNAGLMRNLHPEAPALDRSHPSTLALPPELSQDEVLKALRAFPAGTAPGPSGLRVQHLLDAMGPGNRAAVLEQLAALVGLLARGEAPVDLAPHLAGAKLFAASKQNGGMRPIAVGDVLRRLTAKCLCQASQGQGPHLALAPSGWLRVAPGRRGGRPHLSPMVQSQC